MYNQLYEIMQSKAFASFYSNPDDTGSFVFGRILGMNDQFLAIYMLSPNGDFDGVLAKRVDDIFRIEVGGLYAEKMLRLFDESNLKPIDSPMDNDAILMSLLSASQMKQQVVAIEQFSSGIDDIVGIVGEITDNCVSVFQIDAYGVADGTSYSRITDITQISYMSQDEQRICRLWAQNKKFKIV